MALKITKSTDEVKVERLKTLIYGTPGSGKTSLAFTADKPLLLDFDAGSYRAGNRQDTVEVETWQDVSGISPDDLKSYNAVIIDTAGRMLDIMSLHLIATDYNARKRDGTLSIQGFGKLKSMFDSFMSKLIAMKKDVILIAHEKEKKVRSGQEEITVFRPDIQGGSLNVVKRSMDLIGYLHVENNKRVLNFNPTETTFGKNSSALPVLDVPDITEIDYDTFLQNVLTRSKTYLNQQSKSNTEFYDFKRKIAKAQSPVDFDKIAGEISKKDAGLKKMLRTLILERGKQVGVEYNPEAKKFVKSQPETENA